MLLHNLLCSAQRARPNYGRVLLRAACAASITGVFYSAQRARPQLRACFAPCSVRGLNYGRVLLRAACAALITGVFGSAQRARPQLRACFAPRSVRDPITGVFELKSRVILLSIEVWGAKTRVSRAYSHFGAVALPASRWVSVHSKDPTATRRRCAALR